MSFYNTGNPVPSDDPRDLDDNAKIIDVVATSTELSTTDRQGREIRTLAGLQYDASQGTLRTDLASDTGAGLVFLDGRPVSDTINDTINVKNGKWGAIGDGTYHPLSERYANLGLAQAKYPFVTSLTQSIDWAAIQKAVNTGRVSYAPSGAYVLTDGLSIPQGSGLLGDNASKWVTGFVPTFFDDSGTILYMYGTGAKTFTLPHVSSNTLSGGTITNPSAGEAHYATANTTAATYSVIDFTNKNAVGANPATQKAFSVGINVEAGGNVRLENFRVLPWYNGSAGYQDALATGLGDDWDVGLYLRNTESCYVSNVQVVGYWRVAGCLKACVATAWNIPENNESETILRCKFQGHTGFAVRSYDMHKIAAKTANTISIPWYSSHTFVGNSRLLCAAGQFKYSTVTFDAGNQWLTFTVEGSTASVAIGGWLTEYGTTWGTSGTQLIDCQISDLGHSSRMCSTNSRLDTPFPLMGKALELAGEPTRAIQLTNCTLYASDDIMVYQTRSRDAQFIGCYSESKPAYAVPGGGNVLPAGGRWIAIESASGTVPVDGGTVNLRMVGTINQTVDLRPYSGTAQWPRFSAVGDVGFFKPETFFNDIYNQESSTLGNTTLRSTNDINLTAGVNGQVVLTKSGGTDLTVRGRSANLDVLSVTRVRFGTAASDGTGAAVHAFVSSGGISPNTDGDKDLGSTSLRFDEGFINRLRISTGSILPVGGNPEGGVTANQGSLAMRTAGGGVGSTLYYKASGAGNTGWVAIA